MFPQFIVFCFVGLITTAVDFLIYNLLTRRAVGWRRIPANIVSVSAAMLWSFLANWFVVFQPAGSAWLDRAGRFLITTLFSAFILQNLILYCTTSVWKAPANFAIHIARQIRGNQVSEDLVSRNTCKALAVSAGLVWNFLWYKYFVYAA